MRNSFQCVSASPEVICWTAMIYIRFPLSLRQVDDIPFEGGIGRCHETMRFWWNLIGAMFAAETEKRRQQTLRLAPYHPSMG
jgi:putative transposase